MTWNVTPPLAPTSVEVSTAYPSTFGSSAGRSHADNVITLRGDFSSTHTTLLTQTPAIAALVVGDEILPGAPAWTDLQACEGFDALAKATSLKVTSTLSGGSVRGWQKLVVSVQLGQAPSPSGYSAYLSDYKMWVEMLEGKIDYENGLSAGLRKKHDEREATKKAAPTVKAAPKAADPTSKRSIRKIERSKAKAAADAQRKNRETAERNLAQSRANALVEEKKKHVKKCAELKATLELQTIENAVASASAARAAKIRSTDPSLIPSLEVESGWKLVTKQRTPRVKQSTTTRTVVKAGHPSSTVTTVRSKTNVPGEAPST